MHERVERRLAANHGTNISSHAPFQHTSRIGVEMLTISSAELDSFTRLARLLEVHKVSGTPKQSSAQHAGSNLSSKMISECFNFSGQN